MKTPTENEDASTISPPREALRCLQQTARLTEEQAESYLREVRAERLAAETQMERLQRSA